MNNEDDVQFEIITDRVWYLPRKNFWLKLLNLFKPYYKHPEPSSPIKIGIRITNNTDTPLRFNFNQSLIPELFNIDGQIPTNGFCIRPEGIFETELPLIKRGETISFLLNAVIFWHWANQFGIHIIANDGFFWYIEPLTLGTYSLKLTYTNHQQTITISKAEGGELRLEDFWLGQVSIPSVEVCIVKP